MRDVELPGGTGRWDYQAIDRVRHRLYIAHLGASAIVIYDLDTNRVMSTIGNIVGVHGVLVVPEANRLYATATGTQEIAAIDTATLVVVRTAHAGEYPDGLDYAPGFNKVFVTDEHGAGDVVFAADSLRSLGSIALGADIGNTKYDPVSKTIYVAVGSSNEPVEVEPASQRTLRRLMLSGCEGAHGLQLTEAPHRAFVGCEGNDSVVVYDFSDQRVVNTFKVGQTPDVLAYDPNRQRVYVACEDGTLVVFDAGQSVTKLGDGAPGPDTHTVAVDPSTGLVYLPMTDVNGHAVLRVISP